MWQSALSENVILRSVVPHQALQLEGEHNRRGGAGGESRVLGELVDVAGLLAHGLKQPLFILAK